MKLGHSVKLMPAQYLKAKAIVCRDCILAPGMAAAAPRLAPDSGQHRSDTT